MYFQDVTYYVDRWVSDGLGKWSVMGWENIAFYGIYMYRMKLACFSSCDMIIIIIIMHEISVYFSSCDIIIIILFNIYNVRNWCVFFKL